MTYQIPEKMRAWVLGNPGVLTMEEKPVPQPGKTEVLVRIDAVAICATDLEVIERGTPAMIQGGLPFNKGFIPGHEYMGTIVKLGPGVDEYKVGDRVAVEIHAGCNTCERCREGMYTACLNYGRNYEGNDKGHRANGFTTDGGFAEYAINSIKTLTKIGDNVTDEEATLIVTAGTAMYGLDMLGGLVAGQPLVVTGPGPIGLMAVGAAKAWGAKQVIALDVIDEKLAVATEMGADVVLNSRTTDAAAEVVRLTDGGADVALDYTGVVPAIKSLFHMITNGGRIVLVGLPNNPIELDLTSDIIYKEATVVGSTGRLMYKTWEQCIDLINSGKFNIAPVVSGKYALRDFEQAFDAIKAGKPGKMLLIP